MPNLLENFSDALAARAEVVAPGSAAAAAALRASGAALDAAAANAAVAEAAWRAALADWRAKLTTLTQATFPGGGPLALILEFDRLSTATDSPGSRPYCQS